MNGHSVPPPNGSLNGSLPVNGASTATNGNSANTSTTSLPLNTGFAPIAEVIQAFANDEFVIVLDSPSRENEGDLIIAAEAFTPEKASFMIRYSSGYICAPITVSRAATLGLPQMVTKNQDPNYTAYTVTIDGNSESTTTGISAQDRSLTCRMLAQSSSTAASFRRPGHIIPLQAREQGVRFRRGHTEAAVDLCRLAGKQPVGVICELITDGTPVEGKTEFVGGGMMRRDECLEFGKKWGIKVCTIEDLVAYMDEQGIVLGENEGRDGLKQSS